MSQPLESGIIETWDRLHAWFKQHIPSVMGSFNPSATENDLREFEATIGLSLPADVRSSYLLHDGQFRDPGCVFGLNWLSLDASLSDWKRHSTYDNSGVESQYGVTSFPEGAIKSCYWHPAWIPLTCDSGGNYLGIDMEPGSTGSIGQVIVYGRDDSDHHVAGASWHHFLTSLANELESGNFIIEDNFGDVVWNTIVPPVKHFHSAIKKWCRDGRLST